MAVSLDVLLHGELDPGGLSASGLFLFQGIRSDRADGQAPSRHRIPDMASPMRFYKLVATGRQHGEGTA